MTVPQRKTRRRNVQYIREEMKLRFADRLNAALTLANVSVGELAERIDEPITQSAIYSWLDAKTFPAIDTLVCVCDLLRSTPGEFLDDEEPTWMETYRARRLESIEKYRQQRLERS